MKYDLTGKEINGWVVVGVHDPPVDSHGEVIWDCICPFCNSLVQNTAYKLRTAKTKGCKYCKGKRMTKDIARQKFGRLTAIEYFGSNKGRRALWKCLCDCGNETIVDVGALKNGKTKSCGCLNREQLAKPKEDLTGRQFGYLKVLSYTGKGSLNNGSIWNVICTNCGNTKEITRHELFNGTMSCGCIKSKSEVYITKYLKENEIDFKSQYTFDDLKSFKNNPLRFDFGIFENDELKLLIEYQGIQHFKSIDYYNGEEGFKLRQEYDNLKRQYCQDHNIDLIEISYKDNLKERLDEIFKNES